MFDNQTSFYFNDEGNFYFHVPVFVSIACFLAQKRKKGVLFIILFLYKYIHTCMKNNFVVCNRT